METIAFGNTDLQVTRIGLGMAALGRPGYINLGHHGDLASKDKDAMERQAHLMLDKAYQLGIRYFDAARSYGAAEEFLGTWLEKQNPSCIVGSKWGYTYTAQWEIEAENHEIKEHSVENLKKQWRESQSYLNHYLDIYQIHSAKLESGVLDNAQVLDELWHLREQGIIIGLSLSGEEQSATLEKALTIKNGDDLLFQSVQATYNILETAAENSLLKASKAGVGVIIKEAVANGRLTSRNTQEEFVEKKAVLEALALKYKVGIDAIALAFVLSKDWVTTVLSGASTPQQLASNIDALQVNFTEEDLKTIKGLHEVSSHYWANRTQLAWN